MGQGARLSMASYMVASGCYIHPRLGKVHIAVRSNSVNFSARWRGGELYISVPRGTTVGQFEKVLAGWEEQLCAKRPAHYGKGKYYEGFTFESTRMKIVVERSGLIGPDEISPMVRSDDNPRRRQMIIYVMVGREVELESLGATQGVSRIIERAAKYVAMSYLINDARDVARRVGVSPREWKLGSGQRVLGRCSSKKVISLSSKLVLLPDELRDYVVCHELAHLQHMDHSDQFHSLCNAYCGGREEQLKAALRKFEWPLV